MKNPKFPHITVRLNGEGAFDLISKVQLAMRRGRIDPSDRDAFFREATASCREPVLNVVKRFVKVEHTK